MLKETDFPGGRCPQLQFPSIPFSIPASFADGRELGDTGCRGRNGADVLILDLVTEPTDARGSDRSFRC